ncbi:hypothetical protein KJ652_02170 [Patescibacteria group bacterium]|nr:hypothetical protein [Patescibacteria group bacterium]MBU1911663.1 hypothetical protein [Patescibacteria group bacterium]
MPSKLITSLLIYLLPQKTFAALDFQSHQWSGFGGLHAETVIINLGQALLDSGYWVCAAIFVTGTAFYIGSVGNDTYQGYGKGMMIGSVIGALVIFASHGIMNTVLYFLSF